MALDFALRARLLLVVREAPPGHVTRLLLSAREGDEAAQQELMDAVYGDLRRIARARFRNERVEHTLQPTALVHEVYARLAGEEGIDWQSRSHFFAVASRMMRRILINHARDRRAAKRRGVKVAVEPEHLVGEPPGLDVVALDEALSRLEAEHARCAQVVEMRYFGGMSHEEIASVLGIGVATVKRDWTFARSWLLGVLRGELST